MFNQKRVGTSVAAAAALLAASQSIAADVTPFFEGVGTVAGGGTFIAAISADGTVVAGNLGSPSIGGQGFRWTRSTGRVPIGRFGVSQTNTTVLGLSGDGSTMVGFADPTSPTASPQAIRWTVAHGLQPIPGGIAYAASFDGSVIAGETPLLQGVGLSQAFRWTALTGPIPLGTLSGDLLGHSGARGISADGLTITGYTDPFIPVVNRSQAFLWSPDALTTGLGYLFGGSQTSVGNAICADGTVIVGESDSNQGRHAFRWNADEGMVDLGAYAAGFASSRALAVSGNGTVIVGSGTLAGVSQAFVWTPTTGIRSLKSMLQSAYGMNIAGWQLSAAKGVSADGRIIVGDGVNPCGQIEGWIAHLGPVSGPARACTADFNADSRLSVQDIFDFLNAWFAGSARADLNQADCVTVDDIFVYLNLWFAGCP